MIPSTTTAWALQTTYPPRRPVRRKRRPPPWISLPPR
ncbi:MAG: hypothetical protein RJA98_772, partial [Pseudomonadota bacterium]